MESFLDQPVIGITSAYARRAGNIPDAQIFLAIPSQALQVH